MSASTVNRQTASPRTRVCPICEKKFKYLSGHLKNTHKLTTQQERAPHLKRSLSMENDEEWFHLINLFKNAETKTVDELQDDNTDNADRKTVKETTPAVKRGDTVLEEGCDNTADAERKKAELCEHERTISANFQQIEDHIVALRLKAMGLVADDSMMMARVRLEVREHIMPLYQMVMAALVKSLLDADPPKQLKRVNEHSDNDDARKPKPKRRKKRTNKPRRATDVCFSGCGLDQLKNGLVRCQLCMFTWDGNAQHDCPYYDAEVKNE